MSTKSKQKYGQLEKTLEALPSFKPSLRLCISLRFKLWQAKCQGAFLSYLSFLRLLRKVVSNVALAIVFFTGTVSAYAYLSNSVNPSTPFFGKIELLVEGARLATASSVEDRVELKLELAKRRVAELELASELGSLAPEVLAKTTDTVAEALDTAKRSADTRVRVKAVKSVTELSSAAANKVSESKVKAVSSKATAKAKEENVSDDVIKAIEYKTQGINLSSSSQVAANKEPSLSPESSSIVV